MKIAAIITLLALVAPSTTFAAFIGTQKISVKISHVEGTTLDKTCTDAIKSAIMTSFNTVHLESDFSVAYTEITTERIREDTNVFVDSGKKSSMLRGMPDWSWTTADIGANIIFGCHKCDHHQDNVLPGFFLEQAGASPLDAIVLHRQFEIETRNELHASDCAAFSFLRDVEILYMTSADEVVTSSDILVTAKSPRPLNSKQYRQTMATEISGVNADRLDTDCLELLDKLSTAVYNTVQPGGDTGIMLTDSWSLRGTLYADESTTTMNDGNSWGSSWSLVSGVVDFVCWNCSPNDSDKLTPGALQLQFRASHRDFELALMGQLKDATYCNAFDDITDLKVHYGVSADTVLLANKIMKSPTSPDTPALLADKTKKTMNADQEETEEVMPISIELTDVDLDTMTADCMGLLNEAIVHEYNALHTDDDVTLIEATFTTETFIAPENNGDSTGLGFVNTLVRPITWNTSWGKVQGYVDHKCRYCNPDNNRLRVSGTADDAGLASIHQTFESNVMANLKASSCEAFGGLVDVQVSLGYITSSVSATAMEVVASDVAIAKDPLKAKMHRQALASEITGVNADRLNTECLELLDRLIVLSYNAIKSDGDVSLTDSWSTTGTLSAEESKTTKIEVAWGSSSALIGGFIDFVCWDCISMEKDNFSTVNLQSNFKTTQRNFELILLDELKDATSCNAFEFITDVKIYFGANANTVAKTKMTSVDQEETEELAPISVDLTDVDMDTMTADCMGLLNEAIVHEYNALHTDDDVTLIEAIFTTETFIAPENNGDSTGLGFVNTLVRPITWNTSWGKVQGYVDHKCRYCNPDNNRLRVSGTADDAGLASIHQTFESNVMANLKASSCEAFGGLTDVGITFGNSIISSE